MRGVDDGVGRLLAHLEKTGELERTVIVYTSDQGFMLGEHDYIDKRWIYEESLRVPLIVRWPSSVEPGTIADAIVNNVDFAPSLLDIAGADIPESMQGRSVVPILEGSTPADWRTATYYRYWMHMTHHDNPAHFGIRTRDFKLVFFYGLPLDSPGALAEPTPPHWELYDLRTDPREMRNVYADPACAQTVRRLESKLFRLQREVGDTDEDYPELRRLRGSWRLRGRPDHAVSRLRRPGNAQHRGEDAILPDCSSCVAATTRVLGATPRAWRRPLVRGFAHEPAR